ncbi:Neuroligin-2 [Melipona quadrifasciata]|uniref:Neuroligin-2 n=1 Tax=Melipona quadrifasciata TaxID=166423 RepID=A0A0N0BGX2_9HYME|nr:Neuroligin-2 [Melipona quadrifasciata]
MVTANVIIAAAIRVRIAGEAFVRARSCCRTNTIEELSSRVHEIARGHEEGDCRSRDGSVETRYESRSKKCLATMVVFLGLLCGHWCSGGAEALAGSQKYSTRTIRTRYGTLRGVEDRSSTSVETYYGVPYATPPVGSLRYMPPVTPTPWRGTKLADTMPPACPQKPPEPDSSQPRSKRAHLERLAPLLANQSEDCLYLNLYVPKPPHVSLSLNGYEDDYFFKLCINRCGNCCVLVLGKIPRKKAFDWELDEITQNVTGPEEKISFVV